jgi:hypothetical protein
MQCGWWIPSFVTIPASCRFCQWVLSLHSKYMTVWNNPETLTCKRSNDESTNREFLLESSSPSMPWLDSYLISNYTLSIVTLPWCGNLNSKMGQTKEISSCIQSLSNRLLRQSYLNKQNEVVKFISNSVPQQINFFS